MIDYFKPCYMGWHRPYTFFYNIRETFYWLRSCHQRAFKGWADCDCWDMDYYLSKIIPAMLRDLKDNRFGQPEELTEEEWDKKIDEMIEGFEAARRVIDLDYPDNGEDLGKMVNADQKLFKAKGKLFIKWFFDLWD